MIIKSVHDMEESLIIEVEAAGQTYEVFTNFREYIYAEKQYEKGVWERYKERAKKEVKRSICRFVLQNREQIEGMARETARLEAWRKAVACYHKQKTG